MKILKIHIVYRRIINIKFNGKLTLFLNFLNSQIRTKNGQEITSSSDYILETEGEGVYALTIPQAFFADTGRYAVIAENPAGKSVSSGYLTILGKYSCEISPHNLENVMNELSL